jgi:hypothetical protein
MRKRFLILGPVGFFLAACVPEGTLPATTAPVPPVVLATCAVDAPKLGRLTVAPLSNATIENQLTALGIDSPSIALRILAQQSRCFEVLDYDTVQRQRRTANAVLPRPIYVLNPSLSYSAPNATAQAAPANIQRQTSQDAQTALGIAASATRAASASVSLWITEIESGRQIAIGQGNFQGTDFDIGAALLGPQAAGMLSGFAERVEGRAILAALLRAFNATLEDARTAMPDDALRVASESTRPAAAAAPPQPVRVAPVLTPDGKYETVAGVNFRSGPNEAPLRQLPVGTTVVATGKSQGEWWEVVHNETTGWLSGRFLRLAR